MSMRKIADKLKNEEQKLQMASEDVDDDDDLEGTLASIKYLKDINIIFVENLKGPTYIFQWLLKAIW